MATKKVKEMTTEKKGVTFVSNTLQPYSVGEIDAKKIYELTENVYISGSIRQLINLILSGDIQVSVYNETDDVDEEVSRKLNRMFHSADCNITALCRTAINDLFTWGISPYNWVWERVNGEIVCTEINHLHPFTFRQYPIGRTNTRVYGRLLHGIYYDTVDGQIHYCQTNNVNQIVELDRRNLFIIKDSSATTPDGDSIILPTAPIAEFLDYAWNALGQQMYRTGAPIMFITVTNPQPTTMINGEYIEGDVEYANKVLANWGKDTQYILRDNMTINTIDVKEGSLAIVSINKANETIRDYISPVGLLGKDGTLIAGNSNASLRLINNHIRGWINLLETSLRELPNYYLRANGYPETYHAEITIPTNSIEDTAGKINQANLLATTGTGTVNEVRELLGLEGISTDEMKAMKEEWDIVKNAQQGNPESLFFAESSKRSSASYKRETEISKRAENEIESSADDLLHGVIGALRTATK